MYTIATLHQLQQHIGLDADGDSARLLDALQAATAQIERFTKRRFCPYIATINHTPQNSHELTLSADLLELTALINGDDSVIPPNDVLRIPWGSPTSVLALTNNRAFTWTQTREQAIAVTGIWGWHDTWAQAWRDSGDVVAATMDANETELVVGQADAEDAAHESPRFQVGHLLKLDAEYLRVTMIDIDPMGADTLCVQRGVNGTTAANHALSTPIYTFQPAEDVNLLAVRWAAWLYKEPDLRTPEAIPQVFIDTLRPLIRPQV